MRDSKLDLEKANVGYFRWKLMWIPDVLKFLAGRLGRWFCWPLMTPVDLVPARVGSGNYCGCFGTLAPWIFDGILILSSPLAPKTIFYSIIRVPNRTLLFCREMFKPHHATALRRKGAASPSSATRRGKVRQLRKPLKKQ